MVYGRLPEYLGQFDFDLKEVMYYLYLPIVIGDGVHNWKDQGYRIPRNLYPVTPMIDSCMRYTKNVTGREYRHVYLSARKGWATADNPLNRPGWHCDGFGTNDVNFVWWDGPGTRFAFQHFQDIIPDHNKSLTQFDEQVIPEDVITYPEHGVYMLDPYVVHSTPVIETPCMRQYVKVSMSDHRYNLENNSHNYLFDYDWSMEQRELVRNDPHRAQADFHEERSSDGVQKV